MMYQRKGSKRGELTGYFEVRIMEMTYPKVSLVLPLVSLVSEMALSWEKQLVHYW